MTDLSLKLVIRASNDGAITALNQVIQRAQASGTALNAADQSGTFGATRKALVSVSTQLANLQSYAARFYGADALFQMGVAAIRAADEMRGVEARVKLASASVVEFNANLASIRATAQASGAAVSTVAALFNRISQPIAAMGGTATDAQRTVAAVGQALRISGASAEESASTFLQFAQALGAGVLQGDELRSMLENAPRLAKAIADGLGVTIADLRKMGADGVLTSQQVFTALKSQMPTLAEEAARVPLSAGAAWVNLQEAVKKYIANIDSSKGISKWISNEINAFAESIPAIGDGLINLSILLSSVYGARTIAAITAKTEAQRIEFAGQKMLIADARVLAAADTQRAELAYTAASAIRASAVASVEAAAAAKSYAAGAGIAAAADMERAAAARLMAANQGLSAASGALATARAAEEAVAKTSLMAGAMSMAANAGRGLLAIFGGWPGLVITGITGAYLAWEHFHGSVEASKDAISDLKTELAKFKDFSGKAGPEELAAQLEKLKGKAAELRDKLMDPAFRMSGAGQAAAKELAEAEAAMDAADAKAKKSASDISELIKQKGLLGIANLKLGAGGLIDDDAAKAVAAFRDLYKAFSEGARGENGKLKVSFSELSMAIDALFSKAKTPAEFSGLIDQLAAVMAGGGAKSPMVISEIERAIQARSDAEKKSLETLVSGLQARLDRTQALFGRSAAMLLAQYQQSVALAKVAADLANDVPGASRLDVSSRNAEVVIAQQSAAQQIAAVEEVAKRKRQLILENAAGVKMVADDEIAAARKTADARLEAVQKEFAGGSKSAAELADARKQIERDYTEKTIGASTARAQAEANASRQIRTLDAETAQARAKIAEDLYKTIQGKAAEALSQYKQYAQQVISIDQKIATNRLDTMAAINNLQRSGMSPEDQLKSLRDELAIVQAATQDAIAAGRMDQALDLLNRQKALAQSIGQQSGDGIDKAAQIKEGSEQLARIGAEAEGILQAQRAAAQQAAQEQLKAYNEMAGAMNALAKQISDLNANAAIKLKTEIDKASLDGAIAAVQAAFAGVTIPVKIQPVGMPTAANDTAIPARAYGGPLPGSAPHDRADNMLYWGTPGEHVMQIPAVRYYGRSFMDAINNMRLPRYAFGGAIGGSAIDRLAVPSLSEKALSRQSDLAGMTLDLSALGLGKHQVQAPIDVQKEIAKAFRRLALSHGRD